MKSQPAVFIRGENRSKIRVTARLDSLAPCPGKRKARGLHRDVRVRQIGKRRTDVHTVQCARERASGNLL